MMAEPTSAIVKQVDERKVLSYIVSGRNGREYLDWFDAIMEKKVFSLPFSYQWLAKVRDIGNDRSLDRLSDKFALATVTSVVSMVITALVVVTADTTAAIVFHTELPTWAAGSAGATIIGVGTFGINPFFSHKRKKYQALRNKIAEKLASSLSFWMFTQTKINISYETSKKALSDMIGNSPFIRFTDVDGIQYALSKTNYNAGYQVLVEGKKKGNESFTQFIPKQLEKTTKITQKSSALPTVPTKANQLRERIRSRVNMLSEFTLNVETEHAVARITSDMQTALDSYQKLYSLTSGRKGAKNLLNVLTMLDGEMAQLIEQESEQIVKELVVQESYVSARQGNDLSLLVEK
jgi:hypothetical protein